KLSIAGAMILAAALVPLAGAGSASAAEHSTRIIHKGGTGTIVSTPNGSGSPAPLSTEIQRAFGPEAQSSGGAATLRAQAQQAAIKRAAGPNRSLSRQHGVQGKGTAVASAPMNAVQADSVIRSPRVVQAFDGINHRDQRL